VITETRRNFGLVAMTSQPCTAFTTWKEPRSPLGHQFPFPFLFPLGQKQLTANIKPHQQHPYSSSPNTHDNSHTAGALALHRLPASSPTSTPRTIPPSASSRHSAALSLKSTLLERQPRQLPFKQKQEKKHVRLRHNLLRYLNAQHQYYPRAVSGFHHLQQISPCRGTRVQRNSFDTHLVQRY
jgi:hypothetical protein